MDYSNQHTNTITWFLKELENLNSTEEVKDFVDRLKNKDNLEEAIEGAILFLEDHEYNIEQLKQTLGGLESRIENPTVKNENHFNWTPLLKYAALLLLPLLIYTLYKSNDKPELAKYYLEEPGLPNLMDNNGLTPWALMMKHYTEGNYTLAIRELYTATPTTQNDTFNYFMGINHYKLNNFDSSTQYLQKVANLENSSFHADAEFRLGFSLYYEGKIAASQEIFYQISQLLEHPYQVEANEIIENVF